MATAITPDLLNEYFKRGKKNAAYIPSDIQGEKTIIDIYNELRIHANGEYPADIIDKQRPSEPMEVMNYRKQIFQAITKETVSRIITCLSKIRRSSDWSIRFDPKTVPPSITDKERPEQYFSVNFPAFESITNWMFSVALKSYVIDANAICAVMPLETEVEANQYKRPFPFIFNSDQVLEYMEGDFSVILSKDKSSYTLDDGKTRRHDGKIFWVITTERILKYEQVNAKGDLAIKMDYQHLLGYMPAFKLGGIFLRSIDKTFIYESRIQPIVPRLNKASREDNDLDVSVVRHLFPEKWEFVSAECPKCKGVGSLPDATLGLIECGSCKGFGRVLSSPFQTHVLKPAKIDEAQVPIPPAGYIDKDTEIVKLQDERIEKHIYKALATINMEFLSQTPQTQSGVAKEVDKDELNNFVHSVAEDLVRILDHIFDISYDIRYKFIVSDEGKLTEMLPTVNVPEKYDILSVNYLLDEYQKAKTSKMNPVIISKMEEEIATKRFSTDPDMKDELLAILKLDPFAGMTSEDKMAYNQNGWIEKKDAIISANIVSFVRRAKFEDDKFYTIPVDEQQKKMIEYADEKIKQMSAAAKVMAIAGEDDEEETDDNADANRAA